MNTIPDPVAWQKHRAVRKFSNRGTFFNIPAFTGIANNIGISLIATQFNYQASQHFTITTLPIISSNISFVACIKYVLAGGVVKRFKLWENVGETIIGCPLYAGQKIYKNFTIEIWTIPDYTTTINEEEIKVSISIKRYVDNLLHQEDVEECTGVQCSLLNNINVLEPPTPQQFFYTNEGIIFIAGNLVTGWTDNSGNGRTLTVAGLQSAYTAVEALINNKHSVTFDNGKQLRNISGVSYRNDHFFIVTNQLAWILNRALITTDTLTLKQNNVSPRLAVDFVTTLINTYNTALNTWFIIAVKITHEVIKGYTLYLSVFDFQKHLFTANYLIGDIIVVDEVLTLIFGGANIKMAEIIGYQDALPAESSNQVIAYLGYKFNLGLSLPLQFNACAVVENQ